MAIRPIVTYPDPFLAQKTRRVEEITPEMHTLIQDMIDTMIDAPGVGLAAPQVGSDLRIIVYDPDAGLSKEDDARDRTVNPRALINPEITDARGEVISENEACLSVPEYSADVKRFEAVSVTAMTPEGIHLDFKADGLQAVILQHEIDHLDGILFIDRISRLKRTMYRKKMLKKRNAS